MERLIEAKLAEVIELKIVSEVENKVKDMKEDVEKKMEVARRKSNLVMHGLKEGDDDLERVKAILNDGIKLYAERHVEEVTRIGRFDSNKIRQLRLKFHFPEERK